MRLPIKIHDATTYIKWTDPAIDMWYLCCAYRFPVTILTFSTLICANMCKPIPIWGIPLVQLINMFWQRYKAMHT